MTLLDWGLLVLWLGTVLSGFWKGAIRIVFSAAGAVLGLWLAVMVGPELEVTTMQLVGIHWLAVVIARLLPIIGCLLLFLLAGWGIQKTLEALHLGWLNRLAGSILTGVVGALGLGLMVATTAELSPTWRELCDSSLIAPHLVELWQLVRSR